MATARSSKVWLTVFVCLFYDVYMVIVNVSRPKVIWLKCKAAAFHVMKLGDTDCIMMVRYYMP